MPLKHGRRNILFIYTFNIFSSQSCQRDGGISILQTSDCLFVGIVFVFALIAPNSIELKLAVCYKEKCNVVLLLIDMHKALVCTKKSDTHKCIVK